MGVIKWDTRSLDYGSYDGLMAKSMLGNANACYPALAC